MNQQLTFHNLRAQVELMSTAVDAAEKLAKDMLRVSDERNRREYELQRSVDKLIASNAEHRLALSRERESHARTQVQLDNFIGAVAAQAIELEKRTQERDAAIAERNEVLATYAADDQDERDERAELQEMARG